MGSTLALAYAEAHPERCLGLVMRGIFLCRKFEIDWFLYGMGGVYPEAWRAFAELLPVAERADILGNYHRRLIDPDPAIHMPAAHAWSSYEGACSTLLPSPETVARLQVQHLGPRLGADRSPLLMNGIFMADGAILDGLDRIRHLPAAIVQGRYDIVCPITTADELARAWPEADYRIIPDAGHSAMEPGIRAALVGATERLKALVDGGAEPRETFRRPCP